MLLRFCGLSSCIDVTTRTLVKYFTMPCLFKRNWSLVYTSNVYGTTLICWKAGVLSFMWQIKVFTHEKLLVWTTCHIKCGKFDRKQQDFLRWLSNPAYFCCPKSLLACLNFELVTNICCAIYSITYTAVLTKVVPQRRKSVRDNTLIDWGSRCLPTRREKA